MVKDGANPSCSLSSDSSPSSSSLLVDSPSLALDTTTGDSASHSYSSELPFLSGIEYGTSTQTRSYPLQGTGHVGSRGDQIHPPTGVLGCPGPIHNDCHDRRHQ